MLSLVTGLTLALALHAAPEALGAAPVSGGTHVLGRYELSHAERLAGLFSFDGHALFAVDVRGQSLGWNLDTSLPLGPFAGGRCLPSPPLAMTRSHELLASVGRGGGFQVCTADGLGEELQPPPGSERTGASERPTALAVQRAADPHGKLRFVWGDAAGDLFSWREGETQVIKARAAGEVLALTVLTSGDVLYLTADGKVGRWNGKDAPRVGVRVSPPSCGLETEPCPRGQVRIVSGVFDPDAAWVLVSYASPGFQSYGVGDARTLRFDLTTKEPHLLWELRGVLTSAAFPLSGGQLVAATSTSTPPDIEGPSRVERWPLLPKRPEEQPRHAAPALSVAFSPDGKRLAAGYADGTVSLFDTGNDRELAHAALHVGPLISLVYAPDGKTLAVQPQDGPALLLSPDTGEVRKVLGALAAHPDRSTGKCRDAPVSASEDGDAGGRELAFSPDGSELLASYAEASCASFDACAPCPESYTPARVRLSDGALLERWEKADQPLFTRCSVALGVPILPLEKGGAGAWNTQGANLGRLGLPDVPVTRCATGGDWVVLLSSRGLQLQPRPSGTPRALPLPGKLTSFALSPDGTLALVGSEHEARLVALPSGRRLQVLPLGRSQDAPRAMAFSPDGQRMVVGTQRGIVLLLDNPARR